MIPSDMPEGWTLRPCVLCGSYHTLATGHSSVRCQSCGETSEPVSVDVVPLATRQEAEAVAEALEQALEGISKIRDSIIGAQAFNWSEHMYPLVALLDGAGFAGMPYPEAKEYIGSLIDRCAVAEADRDRWQMTAEEGEEVLGTRGGLKREPSEEALSAASDTLTGHALFLKPDELRAALRAAYHVDLSAAGGLRRDPSHEAIAKAGDYARAYPPERYGIAGALRAAYLVDSWPASSGPGGLSDAELKVARLKGTVPAEAVAAVLARAGHWGHSLTSSLARELAEAALSATEGEAG